MMVQRFFSRPAVLAVLVALVAVGVYANSAANGFAMDDIPIIYDNPQVHGLDRLDDAVTNPYWRNSPRGEGLYRPLTVATYAVEWEVWGADPTGYHVVNILLHGVVSVLVLLLVLQLTGSTVAASVGGLIFAVHPVHTEAVANVVGRAELFAALFYLAACLVYLRREIGPRLRLTLLGLFAFLALGGKEIAFTLPGAILLLELARPTSDEPLLARIRPQLPAYAAIAFGMGVHVAFRIAVLGDPLGNDVAPFLQDTTVLDRLRAAFRVWPEYVRLMLYPEHLVADYSPAVILRPTTWEPIVVAGLVIGLTAVALGVAAWRRHRMLSLGIFWFGVTILPVSNLIVPIGVLLAERTLYLPSVAVSLAAAAIVRVVSEERAVVRRTALAGLVLLLVLGATRTWTRNRVWVSNEVLFADLIDQHPESFRSQWTLARWFFDRQQPEEGLLFMRRAGELMPNHFNLWIDYTERLLDHGHPVEAERTARHAIEINRRSAGAHALLAQALINQGRSREAVSIATDALQTTDPYQHGMLYDKLALAYTALERWDPAFAARIRSIDLTEEEVHPRYWYNLARIESGRGNAEAAAQAMKRARAALAVDSAQASP